LSPFREYYGWHGGDFLTREGRDPSFMGREGGAGRRAMTRAAGAAQAVQDLTGRSRIATLSEKRPF